MVSNLTLASILRPHNQGKSLFTPSNRKAKRIANKKARLNLKRLAKGDAEQQAMSTLGTGCTRRKPCGRSWCAKCLFWAQEVIGKYFGPELTRMLIQQRRSAYSAQQPLSSAWTFSAVDEAMAVRRGRLNVDAIEAKNKELRKALNFSSVRDAVGFYGLDISLNVRTGSKPIWQPQYYGIFFAESEDQVRRVLAPLFLNVRKWQKPIVIKPLSQHDFAKAARYVLKSNIVRRESYVGTNGRWQTKKRDLKANEEVEIAVFLKRLRLRHRLQLRGLKIINGQLKRVCVPKSGT